MQSKPLQNKIIIPHHRPQKFNDFVGHDRVKKTIKTLIDASQKKNKTLEHILLYGPPGVGKTSLAYIISKTVNANLHIVQGPQLITSTNLINSLSLIQEGDVFFIDEIHSISHSVQEILLTVMEDFKISVLIGKDFNSRLTSMKLPHFTLIGATTLLGKISEPLEERFGIYLHIDFYTINEIKLLLKKYNKKNKNLQLSDDEIDLIANASKGTPRVALKILRRVYDFKLVNSQMKITEIFEQLCIDENGLRVLDWNYLKLFNQKPLGLNNIIQMLQVDAATIETKIEPYLLRQKIIQKTSKGRILTAKGKKLITKNL